jgi:FkbM family methyltransferase
MNTKKFKNYLKKLLYKRGYKLSRTRNFVFLDSILNKLLSKQGQLNYIQIGGNDGINDDPLYYFVTWNKNRIKGFVLEPVLDYFNELKKNYTNHPLIKTLNLAIHNSENEMTIHRVDPKSASVLPKYSKGIASFSKEHHISCKIDSKHILEEKVACVSLENLIKTYNIKNIDLLQIDTEGYDYEIIFNINFKELKPSIINFEYYITDEKSKVAFNKILKLLHENDYEIWQEINDISAYQRNLFVNIES